MASDRLSAFPCDSMTSFRCLGLLLLLPLPWPRAQEPAPPTPALLAEAPPAQTLGLGPIQDLGRWDEVHRLSDGDDLVVRRDDALFRIPPGGPVPAEPWYRAPFLAGATVHADLQVGDAVWLFCNHPGTMPFALDPARGLRLELAVPGLESPPDRPPHIQSLVRLPHLGAALAMVAGGQQDKWPRPHNHPVYFRIDLKGARVERLPVGWDLQRLDAGMTRAAFQGNAIDLRTGQACAAPPARTPAPWVPFDWTNQDPVQPLLARVLPRDDSVVGVHFEGVPIQFGEVFRAVLASPYRFSAQAASGWVALHAHRHGRPQQEQKCLWLAPLQADAVPQAVAVEVWDYAVAGPGRVFFTAPRLVAGQASAGQGTGYLWDVRVGRPWDVMAGIASLPELPAEVRDKPGVTDSFSVHPLGSRGGEVLAYARHQHHDRRDALIDRTVVRVPHALWLRLVLLPMSGGRCLAEVHAELGDPGAWRACWLLRDGWLVVDRWAHTDGRSQQELSAVRLRPADR